MARQIEQRVGEVVFHGSVLAAENLLGDAPAMYRAGAVVNPKRAHVLEDAHDDGLRGHALTAEHLHAAIDHAPDRFGDEDLAHARFEIAAAALIEHPGRVPDRQARGLQIERKSDW